MWTHGSTQKEIAEAIHVSPSTLRNEMLKGFHREIYMGGRRVYDPHLAERNSGTVGRSSYRSFQEQEAGRILPRYDNQKEECKHEINPALFDRLIIWVES